MAFYREEEEEDESRSRSYDRRLSEDIRSERSSSESRPDIMEPRIEVMESRRELMDDDASSADMALSSAELDDIMLPRIEVCWAALNIGARTAVAARAATTEMERTLRMKKDPL